MESTNSSFEDAEGSGASKKLPLQYEGATPKTFFLLFSFSLCVVERVF
jgi:hypothetical protein